MEALVILIPIALGLGGLGLVAFIWALRSGQFEDLDGAALRILIDDDNVPSDERKPSAAREPQAAASSLGNTKSNSR